MTIIALGDPPYRTPLVLTPEGVDDDLSDAAAVALAPLHVSSVPKAKLWLERWLRFRTDPDDDGELAFSGSKRQVRVRFQKFLELHGCSVTLALSARDGSRDVLRPVGSTKDIQVAIAVVRRFYEGLIDCGAFPEGAGNPLTADSHNPARLRNPRALKDRFRLPSGNQFRTMTDDWSPPRISRPDRLLDRYVEAAEAARWPATPLTLLYVMVDDGPRSGDVRECTLADWAAGGLGRAIHAPSKASKGKRVKWVIIADRTRTALIEAVEARHRDDPAHPSFARLMSLADDERWDELRSLPLFPGRFGRPISHSGFHKVYFRPTMRAAGVTVNGRVAWPHLSRHASITRRVVDIFKRTEPGERREALLGELRRDLGFASDQLPTYAWEALLEEAIKARTEVQDRLNAGRHAGDGAPAGAPAALLPADVAADLAGMAE